MHRLIVLPRLVLPALQRDPSIAQAIEPTVMMVRINVANDMPKLGRGLGCDIAPEWFR